MGKGAPPHFVLQPGPGVLCRAAVRGPCCGLTAGRGGGPAQAEPNQPRWGGGGSWRALGCLGKQALHLGGPAWS